jgi:NADH-quinone oxidoreductase subunit J
MLDNLFYLFSFLLVLSSFMVILSKHPVFSVLFLVGSFIFASFLLFLLECEFLALLFIIVYVGAIAVLFLFAVMMLESKLTDLSKNIIGYLPIGMILGILLFFLFLSEIDTYFDYWQGNFRNFYQNWYDLIDSTHDVEVYGQVLYSYFVLQFLIAGLILLLIIIGVVHLTNIYKSEEKTLAQIAFKQLARESKLKKTID